MPRTVLLFSSGRNTVDYKKPCELKGKIPMRTNRRDMLATTAGGLAAAALTGCGGGEEDGAVPAVYAEINAFVTPTRLVPKNGFYQVEVVFNSRKAVTVEMMGLTENVVIGHKAQTDGISHKVAWALFKPQDRVGYDIVEYSLKVTDDQNKITYAGLRGKTSSEYARYQVYDDEYEWNFYSTTDRELLVEVRFFWISVSGGDFDLRETIKPITNSASHVNQAGNTSESPKLYTTNLMLGRHEASVIQQTITKKDTVLLPNNRREGHNELVPTYASASAAERPLLKRRFERHIDRLCKNVRVNYKCDQTSDDNVTNILGNEILRLIGGASFIDHLKKQRDAFRNAVEKDVQKTGAAFANFLNAETPKLTSAELENYARSLRDNEMQKSVNTAVAGGAGVSVNLQAGMALTMKDFPFAGIDLGGGVRVSAGIFKAGMKWNPNQGFLKDEYKVSERGTKGSKFGATFIIKGFSIGNFSGDIEATLNFSILNGQWRIDMYQFDPVLDIDTRTWLGKLAAMGLKRLISPVVNGVHALDPLPAITAGTGPLTTFRPKITSFINGFVSDTSTFISSKFRSTLTPLLRKLQDDLGANAANGRTWGTLEVSILRYSIMNADVNNPSAPFRGGFVWGGIAWHPAVKYIAGFGINPNIKIPYVAPGAPTPPDTVTVSGFARVVAVCDVYAMYGEINTVRAAYYPWDH